MRATSSPSGIEESTPSTACSATPAGPSTTTATARAPSCRISRHRVPEIDLDARPLDVGEGLPHLSGTRAGDSGSARSSSWTATGARRRTDRSALASEKSLIRWAAHSARISDPGMPQTFSV